jgi:hypothetical protein
MGSDRRRPAPAPAEGRSAAARHLATEIERRGLTAPAVLLLEAHRPVAPLIGAAATFLAPLIGRISPRTAAAVAVAEDECMFDLLRDELPPEPDTPEAPCRTSAS